MSVVAVLSDLEGWLARHAPRTHAMVNPPATPDQLGALEAALGFPLVPEVGAALRWHNGTEEDSGGFELVPTFWMLSAESIAADARRLNASAAAYARDEWSDRWVPVAADRGGAYVLVDHGDSPDRGRVFTWDPESGEGDSWSSLADLYSELRAALADRTPLLGCTYELVDGGVEWEDADLAD
ncbi:cell wall assembly regulator SMI1 [Actinoplanes octamycinicus]|uniref:Cell wall assembly regulator SMI1 n=1 Tax=Actinoplanes octamycinicus TaxID=135948 RepID=A0A7W7H459_9ACTN|nr:SMI1/KNR4 family protein [Actinoplanes octamycinicus]MBB4743653.1 cell wall assembly regulator SMI1 [Actinoplanes octamycinicus]GIE61079.1 hypothetical protein Aoc01nite_64810 [Actinoplanes octamycinicus]